jgi:hypothetical protein
MPEEAPLFAVVFFGSRPLCQLSQQHLSSLFVFLPFMQQVLYRYPVQPAYGSLREMERK